MPIEIIVVDNETNLGSREALADGPWRLICLDHNEGFAGGMNAGASTARGAYLALLNNDLILEPDWLEHALDASADDAVGIVGGRDDHSALPIIDPSGSFWLSNVETPCCSVAAVDGGQLFIKSTLWKQLGGFDEDFFAYHEDLDLCARALALGWRVVYDPDLRAVHQRGLSSNRVRWKRAFWARRNRLIWLTKHFPAGAWRRAVGLAMLEYARQVVFGLPGKPALSRESTEARGGSFATLVWVVLNARWLARKRRGNVDSHQYDEGYQDFLRATYSRWDQNASHLGK